MDRIKTPVSGSEPTCTKKPYGTKRGTISANCYQYAIQGLKLNPYHKLQPGNLSGKEGIDFNLNTCHPATRRVIEDMAKKGMGYQSKLDTPCKKGYGKIALLLSKNNDFHFLRQNGDIIYIVEPGETKESIAKKFRVPLANVKCTNRKLKTGQKVRVVDANVWSHKRGIQFPPTLYDARGKVIFDPRKSNFNYGSLNYSQLCSIFCVKQKPCRRKKITSYIHDGPTSPPKGSREIHSMPRRRKGKRSRSVSV
jgi:LysM repeat protein